MEHPNVFGRGGADLVAPHGVGPPGIVDAGVEKIIGTSPGNTVEHIVDHIVEEFPGLQVLNVEGEAFVPLGVGGVGQVTTGIVHGGGAQGEKVVAFGQLVGVEQDFLVGQGTGFGHHRRHPVVDDGHAGGNAVGFALLHASVVPVAAQAGGHRHVGFLHAGFDLLENIILQGFQVSGFLRGVGVFGL